MNLYVLRHASAGTRRVNPLLDHRRPLDKEGKQHCLQLAHALNALKISFDLVVSSPLKRSVQTAQLVATETGYESPILLSNALAPEATLPDFHRLLQQSTGRENVLVVGHNPNLQFFLGSLLMPHASPEGSPVPSIRLRKGSFARLSIERPDRPDRTPAVLTNLIDPRLARALYNISTRVHRRKPPRKPL